MKEYSKNAHETLLEFLVRYVELFTQKQIDALDGIQ